MLEETDQKVVRKKKRKIVDASTAEAVKKKRKLMGEFSNDAEGVIQKKKRRPWRNKVRKLAAKKAAREQRQQQGLPNDVATEREGKRKRKKKRKKKKEKNFDEDKKIEEANNIFEKLHSARFRFINEQLYTMNGEQALELFQEDPQAFQTYHNGFRSQAAKWPYNPVNGIICWLKTLKIKNPVVADMGCGDAKISEALGGSATVHSFDLMAVNERVTACNMARVPLEKECVDVVVFCLSLMGTNINDYIREANRILKKGGLLKIAEVASRFRSVKQFVHALNKMGFTLNSKKANGDGYFLMFEFTKTGKVEQKRPLGLKLEPCVYKKR